MKITIRIIYQGYAAKLMQRASFAVNQKAFKVDPDRKAARIAYEWLKEIKREGHVQEIVKVIYNNDQDITELVKELEKSPS
jgi:predicted O-methyltransferase YrrM